jgi:hypothetical protein
MPINLYPTALDETTRNNVISEMRRWRFDDVNSAIMHIAYSVPEGTRFSDHDCVKILDTLEFDTSRVSLLVNQLRASGMLLQRFDASLSTSVYCMERRVREKYRDDLKKHERDPEPEKKEVSQQLAELVAKITDSQEASFLEETIRCQRVDANRAAIVMAWNLAFHHVRTWILSKHLTAFNAELTSRYRMKTKTHDAVSGHDDFPDGEWFVLEVCRAAGFLDSHRFGILEGALKKRNRYAHPSPAKASGPEATGHVAELLKNVLLDPYFA